MAMYNSQGKFGQPAPRQPMSAPRAQAPAAYRQPAQPMPSPSFSPRAIAQSMVRPRQPMQQPVPQPQSRQPDAFAAMRSNATRGLSAQQQQVYQQAQSLGGGIDPLAVAMGGPQALAQAQAMQRGGTPQRGGMATLGAVAPSMSSARDLGPSIAQYNAGGDADYQTAMQRRLSESMPGTPLTGSTYTPREVGPSIAQYTEGGMGQQQMQQMQLQRLMALLMPSR